MSSAKPGDFPGNPDQPNQPDQPEASHERLEEVDAAQAEAEVEPSLEELLEAARAEAAANLDRFVRARAELDNVQKRHDRDRSERAKYAVEPLARDLLAVVDDLQRALDHAAEGEGGLAEGVSLVLKSLETALAAQGITRMEAAGTPFDPSSHEAVAMIESADVAPDHVLEVHRAGYMLKDRLLRPAMVVVAKAPQDAENQ